MNLEMNLENKFEQIFQESKFTDEELRNIFEETISEKPELHLPSYKQIIFPIGTAKILHKKGEFVFLNTTGSGYIQWILYHTLSGHLVFILRSPGYIWNWNWKHLNYEEIEKIRKNEEIKEITLTSKL